MNTGIYCIEHKESGKKYIGSSSNISFRLYQHKYALRRRIHTSKHLQAAWTKYGEEAFDVRVLSHCEVPELLATEQRYINECRSSMREHGYNIAPVAGSCRGYTHTDEAKRKIGSASKGKVLSAATRKKISESKTGKKLAEIYRASMNKWKVGIPQTLDHVEARSKLTLAQAEEIRAKYVGGGITQKELGALFGVDQGHISAIISGKRWLINEKAA